MSSFDGSSSDIRVYQSWYFKLRSYTCTRQEDHGSAVFDMQTRVQDLNAKANRLTFHYIVMWVTGDAEILVKSGEYENGRAALIALNAMYNRATAADRPARVADFATLNIAFTDLLSFKTKVIDALVQMQATEVLGGDPIHGLPERYVLTMINNALPAEFDKFITIYNAQQFSFADYWRGLEAYVKQESQRSAMVAQGSIVGAAMRGPPRNTFPPKSGGNDTVVVCSGCNKKGHLPSGCYVLHPEQLVAARAKRAAEKDKLKASKAAAATPGNGNGNKKHGKDGKTGGFAALCEDIEYDVSELFCVVDHFPPADVPLVVEFPSSMSGSEDNICCMITTVRGSPLGSDAEVKGPLEVVNISDQVDCSGLGNSPAPLACTQVPALAPALPIYSRDLFLMESEEKEIIRTKIFLEELFSEDIIVSFPSSSSLLNDAALIGAVAEFLPVTYQVYGSSAYSALPSILDTGYKEHFGETVVSGGMSSVSIAAPVIYDVSPNDVSFGMLSTVSVSIAAPVIYDVSPNDVSFGMLSTVGIMAVAMDSGAGRPLCNNDDFMQDLVLYGTNDNNVPQVKVASGDVVAANGIGTMVLRALGQHVDSHVQRVISLRFPNTLFISTLHLNLMSVSHLCYAERDSKRPTGNMVVFGGNMSYLQLASGWKFPLDLLKSNLFYITLVDNATPISAHSATSTARTVSADTLQQLHVSMGHLNFASIKIQFDVKCKVEPSCNDCLATKTTRQPLPYHTSQLDTATRPGEFTSVDFFGPMKVEGVNGERYGMVFVDGFSKKGTTFFTKLRVNVAAIYRAFLAKVQTSRSRPPIIMGAGCTWHSDNEMLTKAVAALCAELSITQTATPPNTPQLNATAENYVNVILGKVRVMLYCAGLGAECWAWAWSYAEFLHERSPQSKSPHCRPIEQYGQVQSVGQMRALSKLPAFGAAAFVSQIQPGKLDPKAREGIFIGFSEKHQAAMVYFKTTKSVVITTHVRFAASVTRVPQSVSNSVLADILEEISLSSTDRSASSTAIDRSVDVQSGEDPLTAPAATVPVPAAAPQAASVSTLAPPAASVSVSPSKANKEAKKADKVVRVAKAQVKEAIRRSARGAPVPISGNAGAPVSLVPPPAAVPGQAPQMVDEHPDPLLDEEDTVFLCHPLNHQPGDVQDLCCLAAMVGVGEELPRTFTAAVRTPEAAHWIEAVNKQMTAFEKFETFQALPESALLNTDVPLWSSVVFRKKYGPKQVVLSYKARLVVDGSTQQPHVHYNPNQIHSPVASMVAGRLMLSAACAAGHYIRLVDIEQAFLQGNRLTQRIVVRLPRGILFRGSGLVLMLRPSFGLKQAPIEWFTALIAVLCGALFGMTQSTHDPCVLIRRLGEDDQLTVSIIVDDLTCVCRFDSVVDEFVGHLNHRFNLSKSVEICMEPQMWLGMEVVYDRAQGVLKLSLTNYITLLLAKFGMTNCKPVYTPMSVDTDMLFNINTTPLLTSDMQEIYMQITGSIIYASCAARPDISIAAATCAQFMSALKTNEHHLKVVTRVLQYLRATPDLGLVYTRPIDREDYHQFKSFTDASFGGELKGSARSVGGHALFANHGLIAWACQRQSLVALSTCEAELVQLSACTKLLVWVVRLAESMGIYQVLPLPVFEDNTSTIVVAESSLVSPSSRHIHVRDMFVREKVAAGLVELYHCPTAEMVADIFTKALDETKFVYFRETLMGRTPLKICPEWIKQKVRELDPFFYPTSPI